MDKYSWIGGIIKELGMMQAWRFILLWLVALVIAIGVAAFGIARLVEAMGGAHA